MMFFAEYNALRCGKEESFIDVASQNKAGGAMLLKLD